MKTENSSILASYVMGILVIVAAAFTEPLLILLGLMIIVSASLAVLMEGKLAKRKKSRIRMTGEQENWEENQSA